MRGKVLEKLMKQDELQLPPHVAAADFEAMYTLLLMARRVRSAGDLTESEEQLVLGALCRYSWPLKPKAYSSEVRTLLSHFQGIAGKPRLQAKFLARVSRAFATADSAAVVKSGDSRFPDVYRVLRKAKARSIRSAARRFRAEGIKLL